MALKVFKTNEYSLIIILTILNIMGCLHYQHLNYTAFKFWFSDDSNLKISNMYQMLYKSAKIHAGS